MFRLNRVKLQAYIRAFRGYCPRCNSEAPAIDVCRVCEGYCGTFPPPSVLPAHWLVKFFSRKATSWL